MSFALDKAKVAASTFWLWKGHCTTHQRFSVKQIEEFRVEYPQGKVIVHPECPYETVIAADLAGSTEKIIDYIDAADAGSIIGVGTEIHLVNRLAKENPDKKIMSLDPIFCPCSTMFRVDRAHLAWTIENIVAGTPVNEIRVDDRTREYSRLSLQRMLDITNS
jgi:quinolinate synthase